MRTQLLVTAVVVGASSACRLSAQQCDSVTSRTSLAAFAGAPIRSLRIVTQSPQQLPGVGRALDRLHVRTRDRTVRRQLLFAAGDTVDTLAVAESIRRLRQDRYLRDVELNAVRCRGAVDLVVRTRDDWSVKPKVQLGAAGKSEIGLTERNLLGSGREMSLHVRTQQGRVGVGVALKDPWFFGSRVGALISQDTYRDGSDLTATLRLREETLLASWGAELSGTESEREPSGIGHDRFERGTAHLLVRRRLFDNQSAVVSLLGGVESESSRLVAAPGAPIVGPSHASRNYVGLSLGASRASVAYDTLTWLVPNDAIVDVPLSFETEAVFGLGHDAVLGASMMHVDLWAGKAWIPWQRGLALADVWASGYASPGGRWDAATFRAALSYYQAARRGFWSTRFTAERLLNPDPDVRTFVTIDPTAHLLPDGQRLASAALGFTVERDVRLLPLTRSWALDGALFGAASSRLESVAPSPEHVDVATLGLGLRLTPARLGRATARLDVGFPVARSSLAKRGLYVGVGLSPWWGDDRHRPTRRD